MKTESETDTGSASPEAMAAAAPALRPGPPDEGLAGDRLVGVRAINQFIDPEMSEWKVQRLLEEGVYPSWKEGRVYVASKRALRERWVQKTRCQPESVR